MAADELPTTPVLGIPIAATDYGRAVSQVKAWAHSGDLPRAVAAANTHVVTLGRSNALFGKALGQFDLILPDGMPLVWLMNRRLAKPLEDRVYGPTFMLRCLEATQGEPWSHVFMGGSEELLSLLKARLLKRFPALRIATTISPPFGAWPAEEDERIIAEIRASGGQFIWIGLGCPKQEWWLARHKDRLPPGVYCAVGAAFAFHAGKVRQSPLWMQRAGLEWLFRLLAEPQRLWRRYLVYNSLFLYYALREALAFTGKR